MLEHRLRIFLAVCEYGTMTAAAEALFMTQSAVSQAIAALEEYYGTALFDRFPRKLTLTEAGHALKAAAQDIIRLIGETDALIKNVEAGGTVRIGANLSVGKVLIHDYLSEFRNVYSDADVQVIAARGSQLLEMLDRGELDFLLMEKADGDDYIQEPFYQDRIVMVVRSDDPLLKRKKLTLSDVEDEPFFLREKGAGVREQFDHLCQAQGIRVNTVWGSSSTSILVNALLHGERGIAVLPYLLVQDELAEGKIIELPISDVRLDRTLYIIRHRSKHVSKTAHAFIDIVRNMSRKQ